MSINQNPGFGYALKMLDVSWMIQVSDKNY
jgi:hypothetical protein